MRKTKGKIVEWLREELQGHKAVIGISGGKDSSVVAALCVEALGKENVVGVLMPQGDQYDIDCSYTLCKHLGIEHYVINIGLIAEVTGHRIQDAMGCSISTQASTNLPSRLRMVTLYGVAQTLGNAYVINTSNLSEDWVGFCTLYGDNIGAVSPLGMLTATEVRLLGYELGLPESLIVKTPEDGLTGVSDEENFGFTYAVLDEYIRTGVCTNLETREKIDNLHRTSRFKFMTIPMYAPEGLCILAEDIAGVYTK